MYKSIQPAGHDAKRKKKEERQFFDATHSLAHPLPSKLYIREKGKGEKGVLREERKERKICCRRYIIDIDIDRDLRVVGLYPYLFSFFHSPGVRFHQRRS